MNSTARIKSMVMRRQPTSPEVNRKKHRTIRITALELEFNTDNQTTVLRNYPLTALTGCRRHNLSGHEFHGEIEFMVMRRQPTHRK
jgi:hypothetical protein